MARTVTEIYDAIIAEKEQQATLSGLLPNPETASNLLADLTSDSKAAIWRLWAFITAVVIYTHEVAWDIFRAEVEDIAAAAPAGTVRWYQAKMLAFQLGDTLDYINNQYVYPTIDEAAQIITRCAVQERSDGALVIKVAKGDATPEPLTTAERQAAESYAFKIKFAGTRLAVSSLAADEITPVYDVYFDPIVPLNEVQDAMQTAVDAFFDDMPFNGEYRVTRFTDVLQSVTGVIDPVHVSTDVVPDGGANIDVSIVYVPAAGYFSMSDTVANLFNFIPYVGS